MKSGDVVLIEVPPPLVKSPRITRKRGVAAELRVGRGYSIGELNEAGLTIELAKQLNVPIDTRRRSINKSNVENLRKFVAQVSELINAKKTKPARNVQQERSQSNS